MGAKLADHVALFHRFKAQRLGGLAVEARRAQAFAGFSGMSSKTPWTTRILSAKPFWRLR
ncbi:hypothetical protein [Breoghania sp.]|uniref:hypothetical protein n=1 Tax=Breoghania sp. TaxID=2065378 RepID=UPI00262FC0CD|nr:hypothetical protein [Breoghania sp.]MDJ0931498.1 hypothetical protein [Breoghania sp.]